MPIPRGSRESMIRTERTEWQLRDKLSLKGFSEGAIEEAIKYVKSFHYLDDYRYAVHFVEFHHEQRSRQRLRQDLYQRHVPEEYIDLAIENVCENDDAALQTALRKLTHGETEFSYEEKQKIAGESKGNEVVRAWAEAVVKARREEKHDG